MFRKTSIIAVIFTISSVFAGLVNVNPDPKGEPWIAGGLKVPADFDRSNLSFIPSITSKDKDLPSRVDNSLHKYFRPIFNQVGGSCAQAAGVGYLFTYEMSRLRDLPADVPENQYPTHFTYDFLNEGSGDVGSWWGDGWDIIKSVGIMNVRDYGGSFATGGNARWISGINEWSSGILNKIASYNSIDVGTPQGLNTLKNWLHNHLENSTYGGLAVFAAGATSYSEKILAEGTHEGGKKVITKWGPVMNHAMTYIGYDDSVRYDYNGDGRFTNNLDINGDRIIDMRDWEIGAMIVANSWGDSFGNAGKIYQMYKLLAEESCEDGGIFYNFVDVVHPQAVYNPEFTLEIKMKHEQRNIYRISTGCSQNLYSETPEFLDNYPFMVYQGGAYYPQGNKIESNKYIEFSIDITASVNKIDPDSPFRFFFMIDESDPYNKFDGEIISMTVVNKMTGRRYYNTSGSTVMVNNGKTKISVIVDENTFIPGNVSVFGGDGIVKLEWTGQESKATAFDSYSIYKNGSLYKVGIDGNSFIDEDVVNSTLYTYKISAVFTGTYNGEMFSYPVQVLPHEASTLPYFIDFESGSDGWAYSDNITTGWILGDNTFSSEFCNYSGNNTKFLLGNPDLAGNGTVVIDNAISPVFNISYFNGLNLEFDYILNNDSAINYICDISVVYRTGSDQEWTVLETLNDSHDWTHHELDIPFEAVSSNFTQFAFFIDNYYQWSMGGGGIDNVSVTGTMTTSAPVITAFFPETPQLDLNCYENVQFSITVEDQDTGSSELTYLWYIDETLHQTGGPEFTAAFPKAGNYVIKAVVSDKYDQDTMIWTITQTDINEHFPLTTRLYQNYPNPFNPETVIKFDNAQDTFVKLNIYNSSGQLVRSLMNNELGKGSYSVVWDGKDSYGTGLSSGVYFYTLEADNYLKNYKMLMFK
jgi:hypothetical protein